MTDKTKAKDDMWAIWPYYKFPYFLMGKVTHYLSDGCVEIEGFKGLRFTPRTLIPGERGEKLKAVLESAASAHQRLTEDLLTTHKGVLSKTLENYGVQYNDTVGAHRSAYELEFLSEIEAGVVGNAPVFKVLGEEAYACSAVSMEEEGD